MKRENISLLFDNRSKPVKESFRLEQLRYLCLAQRHDAVDAFKDAVAIGNMLHCVAFDLARKIIAWLSRFRRALAQVVRDAFAIGVGDGHRLILSRSHRYGGATRAFFGRRQKAAPGSTNYFAEI